MGFRLLFLGFWTPNYIIRRELQSISQQTTAALKNLIPKDTYPPVELKQTWVNIQEQRNAMAQTHVKLVEALQAAFGDKEAVKRGREALFMVGQRLGKETRVKLGVADNPKDLEKAAKILYRVLGIEFHLQWQDSSHATAIIDRCVLAQKYSALTCQVLCATDEGVINGLMPKVNMQFKEYMTNGCKYCKADILFEEAKAQ
jgi:hypothetical protein